MPVSYKYTNKEGEAIPLSTINEEMIGGNHNGKH